jgi:hypothetical protein
MPTRHDDGDSEDIDEEELRQGLAEFDEYMTRGTTISSVPLPIVDAKDDASSEDEKPPKEQEYCTCRSRFNPNGPFMVECDRCSESLDPISAS